MLNDMEKRMRDEIAHGIILETFRSCDDTPLICEEGETEDDAMKRVWKKYAEMAYMIADAMMEARSC